MILPTIAWLSIIAMTGSSILATFFCYVFCKHRDGSNCASVYIFATLTLVLMWAAYESFPFKFGAQI